VITPHTAEQGLAAEAALKEGLAAKSKEFAEKSSERYAKAWTCYPFHMIRPEQRVGGEWAEGYRLSNLRTTS
jgi:hypothetical protein